MPETTRDRETEKIRVREQESVRRDQQLRTPSVARFVHGMERRRIFKGRPVSIFSLMRDGRELAVKLKSARTKAGAERIAQLREAVDPYIQVVTSSGCCEQTGFRLQEIWRYFRHTWATPYESVPGRNLMFLVRDRAAPLHPVVGIGALASPIVQLGERDRWLEWDAETFLAKLREKPSLRVARWLVTTVDKAITEIAIADFVEAGLLSMRDVRQPTERVVAVLRKEAVRNAKVHKNLARAQDFKTSAPPRATVAQFWRARARSRLFKWRRAALLAELLSIRITLRELMGERPSVKGVHRLLSDPAGVRAIRLVVRKARGDRVGIAMADISVCGSIAPYNAILGGKLVSMLAVSPQILDAYRKKYAQAQSEIASAIAGRPIVRPSMLVFMGTTSLYGLGSSQYNRIRIPAEQVGGSPRGELRFAEIGHSESFGSSHFGEGTLSALADLTSQIKSRHEVRNVFGEGVSPRLRKARHGLELLRFPANELLRHGRRRIIYGIALADNTREYLLGMAKRPRYIVPMRSVSTVSSLIATWWTTRWLAKRIDSDDVLAQMASHDTTYPVKHGARVLLSESVAEASDSPDLP